MLGGWVGDGVAMVERDDALAESEGVAESDGVAEPRSLGLPLGEVLGDVLGDVDGLAEAESLAESDGLGEVDSEGSSVACDGSVTSGVATMVVGNCCGAGASPPEANSPQAVAAASPATASTASHPHTRPAEVGARSPAFGGPAVDMWPG